MFLNISSRVNISSFWTNIMLDQVIIGLFWINWMTIALGYFLEWTIFASHTEITTRDWTLAGWCCVLSSQCTSIHLMIHQCHLDLFVKCSHRMRSSIIPQRYGTSVILNTSLDNDTVRWWSSYTITAMEQDYTSLYQRYVRISLISTDVTNSDRHQQLPFQSTSTSTFLNATTSRQSSLIVLKFIVLRKVLL